MIFRKETKETAGSNFVDWFRIDFSDLLPLGSLDLRLVIAKRIESPQRQLTKPADNNTRGLMPFICLSSHAAKRKRKTYFILDVGAQRQDKVQNNFSICFTVGARREGKRTRTYNCTSSWCWTTIGLELNHNNNWQQQQLQRYVPSIVHRYLTVI